MTETARDAVTNTVADRYGTNSSQRIDKRFGWIVGTIAVIVAIGFFAVSGWQQNTTEFKNIGFTLHNTDDGSGVYSATTRFEVTSEPGAHVSCAIEALNTSKATVAWKVIDMPVTDARTQNGSVDLVTIGPATAAHVKACWQVR